ncbi:MAG: hypothetical protein R2713_02345 [Ilumatobacteraceae bacterium]
MFTTDLADHFRTFHGIAGDTELRALGVTVDQRERLVAQGFLVPVHMGVYRACSACDARGAVSSDLPALPRRCDHRPGRRSSVGPAQHGLRIHDRRSRPRTSPTLAAEGIRFRRCNVLDAIDVVERADGIRGQPYRAAV